MENKFTGIIYKYISPSNKIYIGQTRDPHRRRQNFLNLNKSYAGLKIDRAREKYGPENFIYEILFSVEDDTLDGLVDKLDDLEIREIKSTILSEMGIICLREEKEQRDIK